MIKQRKGITPVIAIVLLLLVTVGAVGVVYTQFQNIANQGNTNFNTDARQTEVALEGVSLNADNNDSMQLTWTNKQSSIEINQSESLQIRFVPQSGESGILFQQVATGNFNSLDVANQTFPYTGGASNPANPDTGCFITADNYDEDDYLVETGETITCDTNVKFPGPTEEVDLVVAVQGGDKTWTYTCSPQTSDSQTC